MSQRPSNWPIIFRFGSIVLVAFPMARKIAAWYGDELVAIDGSVKDKEI
jgi:hypothetical protein